MIMSTTTRNSKAVYLLFLWLHVSVTKARKGVECNALTNITNRTNKDACDKGREVKKFLKTAFKS